MIIYTIKLTSYILTHIIIYEAYNKYAGRLTALFPPFFPALCPPLSIYIHTYIHT
jgi:hypothetical protein